MEQVKYKLEHLVAYAIAYFQNIPRRNTEKAKKEKQNYEFLILLMLPKVAVANEKFYINRAEGFIGTALKKDEYVFDCSDIDDVIVFRKDGTMLVTKVDSKNFCR